MQKEEAQKQIARLQKNLKEEGISQEETEQINVKIAEQQEIVEQKMSLLQKVSAAMVLSVGVIMVAGIGLTVWNPYPANYWPRVQGKRMSNDEFLNWKDQSLHLSFNTQSVTFFN